MVDHELNTRYLGVGLPDAIRHAHAGKFYTGTRRYPKSAYCPAVFDTSSPRAEE